MPRAVLAGLSLYFLSALAGRPCAAPAFADSGFVLETVASLPAYQPVGLAWGPDGAMYIWQDNGLVRVMKDGVLLPEPFIDLRGKVNTVNDRGFLGFALDPDFAANGYAYLLYTYEENGVPSDPKPKTSRLTRVTAGPSRYVADPATETIILGKTTKAPCWEYPSGTDCIGSESHSHAIGTVRFGKDGKLLVSVGDGARYDGVDSAALRAQDLNRYEGKILRINKDGTAPGDNPFDDGTNSIRSKVYSYGLRNPYRFGIEPVTGEIYIGDVGWNLKEEINTGRGVNFGWPCFEGQDPQPQYQARFAACRQMPPASVTYGVHTYGGPDGHSAIGGTFLASAVYPEKFKGNFFFADYSNDVIRRMAFGADRKVAGVSQFLGAAEGPVSMEVGPDGHLYYIAMNKGEIRRITLFSGIPTAKASASPVSGSSPLQVSFSSAGSKDPGNLALTYLWEFGDGDTSSAANPTHTYAPATTKTFKVKLTVTNSNAKTAFDTLSITVGSTPPKGTITSPAPGTKVRPGDTVKYAGTASDSDETLSPESMSWSIILHHNDHEHPYTSTVGAAGSFVTEPHGEGEYAYEVILTVTDKTGLQDTQRVTVSLLDLVNKPPVAIAGDAQSVAFEAGATLRGSASDDGLPASPGKLTVAWSQKSGPPEGTATIASPGALETKVGFSKPGEYVLVLTASDGQLQSASEVSVTVAPPVTKPGSNAAAKLYVDFNTAGQALDSLESGQSGHQFWVALKIAEAASLSSFSIQLAYDTVGLAFTRAITADAAAGWVNMLAGQGGTPQGAVEPPAPANGYALTVSASLPAAESPKSPSGSGVLAWALFKVRSPGHHRIEIRKATLKDKDQNENVLVPEQLHHAVMVGATPTGLRPAQRLILGNDQAYILTLMDTRGQTVYRAEGRGRSLAQHISEAKARRESRRVYVLRITTPNLRGPAMVFLGPELN